VDPTAISDVQQRLIIHCMAHHIIIIIIIIPPQSDHAHSGTVPCNQSQPPPPPKFLPTQHSESYLTQHCNLCILTVA
jgi:hypothetical protein